METISDPIEPVIVFPEDLAALHRMCGSYERNIGKLTSRGYISIPDLDRQTVRQANHISAEIGRVTTSADPSMPAVGVVELAGSERWVLDCARQRFSEPTLLEKAKGFFNNLLTRY